MPYLDRYPTAATHQRWRLAQSDSLNRITLTFTLIRVNALNLPISALSSDRNQSKEAPDYLRRLATAQVYNPIMKIELRTRPKYPDLSQPGDDILAVLPEKAPYLSQSKQKKADNLFATK